MTTPTVDFHKRIEQEFFAGVRAVYPNVPIYTPNAKWIEPQNTPWYALHLLSGDTFNASVGPKVERTVLVLHISVYTPSETYARNAIEMAEVAARLFGNKDFRISPDQYVNFRAPNIKTSPDPRSGKFRVIATVPGHRDLLIQ